MKTKPRRRKPARAGRRIKRPARWLRATRPKSPVPDFAPIAADKRDDELSDEESLDREEKPMLY